MGPISPDTSFMLYQKNRLDVLFGMYHDQVLSPFKALFKFSAINITLGLPYLRISPDHGVGENIIGKKIANPSSLIESIKFFNNLNWLMNFINLPKKSLGQNFLVDKNIMNKIVQLGNINEDKTVLEIGPGYGNLTEVIAEKKTKKNNCCRKR